MGSWKNVEHNHLSSDIPIELTLDCDDAPKPEFSIDEFCSSPWLIE